MDEQQIILQPTETHNSEVVADDIKKQFSFTESVETIEVAEPEETVIEVVETVGGYSADSAINHNSLVNRNISGAHTLSAIDNLQVLLDKLSAPNTAYTSGGGFAEFRKWDKYDSRNRVGYFVAICNSSGDITICNDDYPDVYGVTVNDSGFCGLQSGQYSKINSDKPNLSGNWAYDKVCILGNVRVRTSDLTLRVGDYVLPGNDGTAVKSENNIGFRVTSVNSDTPYNEYEEPEKMTHYVTIALVPQNDNVARIVKELNGVKGSIEDIHVSINGEEGIKGELNDIKVNVSGKFENLDELVGDLQGSVNTMGPKVNDALSKAEAAETNAMNALNRAEAMKTQANSKAQEALDTANGAGSVVDELKENLQDILAYEDEDGNSGVQGFVRIVDANQNTLGELQTKVRTAENDIIATKKSIDENGAKIQNIVAHSDRYSIGEKSVTYGLSQSEAEGLLNDVEHYYVPTVDHEEKIDDKTFQFESFNDDGYARSYIWAKDENGTWGWQFNDYISLNADGEPSGVEPGDLWYVKSGIQGKPYQSQTLYRYDGTQWVSVATLSGNARSIGLVQQTVESLTSQYTNLKGDVSQIKQTADEISTVVMNVDGQGSTLQQVADQIIMGTFDPEHSTSLGLMLNGLSGVSSTANHICTNTQEGAHEPSGGKYYNNPPTWNEEKQCFVFDKNDEDPNGKYYFYEPDNQKRYREVVDEKHFKVYTLGNLALASFSSMTTDERSAIDSWTKFKKGTDETMSFISQESTAEGAGIALGVFGGYRQMVEAVKEDINLEGIDLYVSAPDYKNNKFTFGNATPDSNGYYYMCDDDQYYYKAIKDGDQIVGYEKYQMIQSKYASIMQEIDKDGTAIGLVANNNGVDGSIFVKSINGSSSALINADKIGINGTAVFRDNLGDGSTTISGNYIKTGTITSENYTGPVSYKVYGMKIEERNESILPGQTISFTPGVTSYIDSDNETQVLENEGFIGLDLGIDEARWYYIDDNHIHHTFIINKVDKTTSTGQPYVLYTYSTEDYVFDADITTLEIGEEFQVNTVYALSEGEDTDFIYYASVKDRGRLTSISGTYYSTSEIKVGVELELMTIEVGEHQNVFIECDPNEFMYVVSEQDFTLCPVDAEGVNKEIEGTKFDLNNGTIFSQNFSLDEDGKITAKSGYIGDGEKGFQIQPTYISNNQSAYEGQMNINYSGADDINFQVDLSQGNFGKRGVYVGINGIGLGNGTLSISDIGKLTIQGVEEVGDTQVNEDGISEVVTYYNRTRASLGAGLVSFESWSLDKNYKWEWGDPYTYIKLSDGNLQISGDATISGNINLGGNINIHGNITWDVDSNPIKVLYSKNSADKPDGKDDYEKADDKNTDWHKQFQTGDKYASYSYDDGNTWSESPVQIVGDKGDDGADAPYPGYITSTHIDQANILSPNIYGGMFYATGQGANNEAAYYIYDGCEINNITGEVTLGQKKGYICYDTLGGGTNISGGADVIIDGKYYTGPFTDATQRVFFKTEDDVALKIQSGGNMSIAAGVNSNNDNPDVGKGTVYFMSDVHFAGEVTGNISSGVAVFG
jgi:hypothetical protein